MADVVADHTKEEQQDNKKEVLSSPPRWFPFGFIYLLVWLIHVYPSAIAGWGEDCGRRQEQVWQPCRRDGGKWSC